MKIKCRNDQFKAGFWLLALWVWLSGCATNVEVKGRFPTPVISAIPLTIGVFYPEEFKDYLYKETRESREKRNIGIGKAQVNLFSTLLPAMFDKVITAVDPRSGGVNQGVDLVLTMQVNDLQYTVPKDTKIDMYEVWIKYNMQLFDPQGQLIADWMLTAYGKTPSVMIQSEGGALNDAIVVALRDAGASFTLGFTRVPEIKQWLMDNKVGKT